MSEDPNSISPKPADQEPRASFGRLPVWVVMLTALLAYRGCLQVDSAGAFQAKVYPPYSAMPPSLRPPVLPPNGEILYRTCCGICHGENGLGAIDTCPPLDGSGWVAAEGINRTARIILSGGYGPITVKGRVYDGAMPPWKDVITSDEDLAAILTYVRGSWGNQASAVTPAEIKAIRAEEKDRRAAWSADELLKLPPK